MERYSTIFFDLDRTLFDFDTSERLAFGAVADATGLSGVPDIFDRYQQINRPLWNRVESGELTPSEVGELRFDLLVTQVASEADPGSSDSRNPAEMNRHFQHGLGQFGELYPGSEALLDEVSQRARLGLITNGISAVQRAKVHRLGLDRWFDVIVISDEVGVAKPDPTIFDVACEQMQTRGHPGAEGPLDRSGALMIGDSLASDIAGANQAGIASCWFNPTGASRPIGTFVGHELRHLGQLTSDVLIANHHE